MTAQSIEYRNGVLILRYDNGELCADGKTRRSTVILFQCDRNSDAVCSLHIIYICSVAVAVSVVYVHSLSLSGLFFFFPCNFYLASHFLSYILGVFVNFGISL